MVSNMHRLLLREGRNNRSNSDFQTFLRSLYRFLIYSMLSCFLNKWTCLINKYCIGLGIYHYGWCDVIVSSVESQKGVIAAQRCSVENQKGAIAVQSQWR